MVFGVGLLGLSVSHWFSFGLNLLELLGAFAHFTAVLASITLIVSAITKSYVLTGFSAAALMLNLALIIPSFSQLNENRNPDFTIGQFNVYHNNPTPEHSIEQIKLANADVIAIQELNDGWAANINAELSEIYPYKLEEPWVSCCYGIGLYSKFPLADIQLLHFDGVPYISATANVNSNDIQILTFHTQAPAFPNKTKERNAQLKAIAQNLILDKPTVVFGDLNIVSWDPEFKSFLETSNLSLVKNGFIPTYPMDFGLPLIPIDHIMHSAQIEPTSLEAIELAGSDHKGLVAGFRLKE